MAEVAFRHWSTRSISLSFEIANATTSEFAPVAEVSAAAWLTDRSWSSDAWIEMDENPDNGNPIVHVEFLPPIPPGDIQAQIIINDLPSEIIAIRCEETVVYTAPVADPPAATPDPLTEPEG